MFIDQEENPDVSADHADDPATWYGAMPIRSLVEARVGLTLVWPGQDP
jgi:hypothetical protein